MKKVLIISLLSDMCVSDGGVYNSALDMDACHDEYGFPFIPAKRIKGCLRECALELNDWGKNINIEGIFGDKGNRGASLRLGNAYLENYADMKEVVIKNQHALIFHPQNILNHFSYIRTQTSINYETGVAKDTSLRTMRVVNKGCVFKADIEFDEKYAQDIEECCAILTNMGMGRTRGLGEVKVTLGENMQIDQTRQIELTAGANRLEYSVFLEDPVICKSINKGEAETLDYIEGSKILGIIAQRLKEENKDIVNFMREPLYCANAYIACGEKRCVEIPASFYSIKNDSVHYINKVYEKVFDPKTSEKETQKMDEKKQINMMKHCYVLFDDKSLVKVNVRTEERYHHTRPEDKSIGRAIDEAQFYHIESLRSGQKFKGYISGTAEQIRQIVELFSKTDTYYIGYGRNSEYGKVRIQVEKTEKRGSKTLRQCKNLIVKLEAPAIIYNRRAFYSTDVKDLIEEIDCLLGLQGTEYQAKQIDKFLNYTTVGGFNVTWGKRKPTMDVFDKGSVLVYHFESPIDLEIPAELFIGERTAEGYGEIAVEEVSDIINNSKYIGTVSSIEEQKNDTIQYDQNNSLMRELCRNLFKDFVRLNVVEMGKEEKSKFFDNDAAAIISNMIQMCKENNSFGKIKKIANQRYKADSKSEQKKLEYVNQIIKIVETKEGLQKKAFETLYSIDGYIIDEDLDIKYEYLVSFLTELKYRIRQNKNNAKGGITVE